MKDAAQLDLKMHVTVALFILLRDCHGGFFVETLRYLETKFFRWATLKRWSRETQGLEVGCTHHEDSFPI